MPNQRRSLHRSKEAIVAVAAVVGALTLAWRLASPGETDQAAATAPASVVAVPATARTTSVPEATTSAARPAALPAGLTADQWQTLQQRVEPGPLHDREVARIVDFLEFQQDVVHLRELRADPGALDERRALAARIDAGIATHLALQEISAPEATLLKTAVLAETEPDPTQRATRLADWRRQWASDHPPAIDPRVAEYRRQEAAAVAAWQSGPPSQRDPAQLARRLQQLQSAAFDPRP